LIIHLIELEISRQFLGQLENVNWSKPLTERNRYAAVMLLGDVRRRLHYGMNYVDLPEFTSMSSENLNRCKPPSRCWANWIFGVAADEIGAG
jgi:hypothetical protein